MSDVPRATAGPIGRTLVAVLVIGTLAAGGAPGSGGHAARAAGPLPTPPGMTPGSPAIPLAALDAAVAAAYSGAALVERNGGCSGVLVAPHPGPVPPAAPAYVLTNGHCIDLLPATAVRRDLGAGGTVTFGWPGGPIGRTDTIAGVPWASMKATDLAVLELDATLAELAADGIAAVPIAALAPEPGTAVVVVGGPAPAGGAPRQLVLARCTLGPAHDLVERDWSWSGFPSNRCADIRPGSSGSPILDIDSGTLVGLVSTGTSGSEGRSDCVIDRPCEVTPAGARSVPETAYGPLVAGLADCFDAAWTFTGPGGDCPLDPGLGLEVSGATISTNPDRALPDGRPARTTWGAQLLPTDASLTHYATKTGPLGRVDCEHPAGYGAPVALADAPVYDAPLPAQEGRYQLCLLAGPGPVRDATWQQPRFATVVTAWVDRTPPMPPVELEVDEDADGWTVDPVRVASELTAFTWKWGPPAATDCADPEGYAVDRHAPRTLPRADAPTRLCVIGHDEAGNPTPPLDRVFG